MSDAVTEAASAVFLAERLDRLRKLVDDGIARPLSWRQDQLKGLLRFVADHEDAILAALRADLGKCKAEAGVADIIMVRFEVQLMLRTLRSWMKPRRVPTPIAAQPGTSWVQQEPFGLTLILGTWNYPSSRFLYLSPERWRPEMPQW